MTRNVLTIGIVDTHIRIRDIKQALAFNDDPEIKIVFFATRPRRENLRMFKNLNNTTYYHMRNYRVLRDACKSEGIDLIHYHRHKPMLSKYHPRGIPRVLEVHDTGYANTRKREEKIEMKALNMADGIICVSPAMLEYIDNRHPRIKVKNKAIVVYSYPSHKMLPKPNAEMPENFYRCIYQGGIVNSFNKDSKYNHRYYYPYFEALCKNGINIDVYPSHRNVFDFEKYVCISGLEMKQSVSALELYNIIRDYDFGFIGYNRRCNAPVMDMAMPNKLFEYIACGIPVMTMNYSSLAKFVTDTGTGIVVDDDMSLPARFDSKMVQAKMRCLEIGRNYVMEKQTDKIKKFYRRIIS